MHAYVNIMRKIDINNLFFYIFDVNSFIFKLNYLSIILYLSSVCYSDRKLGIMLRLNYYKIKGHADSKIRNY